MYRCNLLLYIFFLLVLSNSRATFASGTNVTLDLSGINRAAIESENDQKRIQDAAVLLAHYEIEAKKLVESVDATQPDASDINGHAEKLMSLSEEFMESAGFRLPQCGEYLAKTVSLKTSLKTISHESLEKNYHQDGALPKAPGECYHTKDLFVHPATVMVLTRDDPKLGSDTRQSIKNEIIEVLAHTEVVRQLVVY